MSNYEPQVGDRVRRTFKDGTFIEGVIARVGDGWGDSESEITLYNSSHPEQTELLERPVKLNTEPGTVYGHPANEYLKVVRVGGLEKSAWLGSTGNGDLWHTNKEVEHLVRNEGWVEYNLDGSRKSE